MYCFACQGKSKQEVKASLLGSPVKEKFLGLVNRWKSKVEVIITINNVHDKCSKCCMIKCTIFYCKFNTFWLNLLVYLMIKELILGVRIWKTGSSCSKCEWHCIQGIYKTLYPVDSALSNEQQYLWTAETSSLTLFFIVKKPCPYPRGACVVDVM